MIRFVACLAAIAPSALDAQGAGFDANNPDVAAIASMINEIAHAVEDGHVDLIADYYSPAAALLTAGEPIVERNAGKVAAARWRKMIGPNRARVSLRIEEINVSGDLAYDRISYTVTVFPKVAASLPGQTGVPGKVQWSGRALEILRREDGAWRYYRVMTSSASDDE